MSGRETVCEYGVFLLNHPVSIGMPQIFWTSLLFWNSSSSRLIHSSLLTSDFVSEVLIWRHHGSIQKIVFECQCRVIWLSKTQLSKNLCQLIIMYKPVKCKIKISVRIWIRCLQKGVKYILTSFRTKSIIDSSLKLLYATYPIWL